MRDYGLVTEMIILSTGFLFSQPSTLSTVGRTLSVAVPHTGIGTLNFISGGQPVSDMVQLSSIIYTWVQFTVFKIERDWQNEELPPVFGRQRTTTKRLFATDQRPKSRMMRSSGATIINAISNSTSGIDSAFLSHFYGDGQLPESLEDLEILLPPNLRFDTPKNGGM